MEETSDSRFSDAEKVRLYDLAVNNKVGLFFLERLKETGQLSPLEDRYARDLHRYQETSKTAVILSSSIAKLTRDFAIFKFVKPYPHTPSDVDVLFFEEQEQYSHHVADLIENGYVKIGECPSQTVVYDSRGGYERIDWRLVDGKEGGKYYIDLYNEVSASHVIYVDKETLRNHLIELNIEQGLIQTLSPTAELCVVLVHSIVPEQLFTIGDYYTTLYFVHGMDKTDLDGLIALFRENRTTSVGRSCFTLIAQLHERVHGFVPEEICYLKDHLGECSRESKRIIKTGFYLPHRCAVATLISVLFERMGTEKGSASTFRQILCMLDPRLTKWVIYNIVHRRTRETY